MFHMRPIYFVLVIVVAAGVGLLLSAQTPRAGAAPADRDASSGVEQRVSDLLRRMTLEPGSGAFRAGVLVAVLD